MAGEFTGEEEAHRGLNLARGKSLALVVAGESGGLVGDALEDIEDEGVHDAHGLLGDSGLGVDLLEHLVDISGEGLSALLLVSLLLNFGDSLGG